MNPFDYITEWRAEVAWATAAQVEQDLILSRAVVSMFAEPEISRLLAFRGGTALYRLHLRPAARYSADTFLSDVAPLVALDIDWNMGGAAEYVRRELLPLLPGEPWRGGE